MHFLFYSISLLPLGVLYVISDLIYIIVYRVVRYRRRVVRQNLRSSFPEKEEGELRSIERGFYRWLCDYFVESIKLLSMPEKEVRRRLEMRGLDKVLECLREGQTCAAMLGHYCNWEWLSCTALWLDNYVAGLIYRPLKSKTFDRLFCALRSRHGGVTIPKKDILRYISDYRKSGQRYFLGYISDQSPRYQNTHLWLNFMNRETAAFTGGERIMKMEDNAVFYVEMERPRRGYYKCTFHLMTRDPKAEPEHRITEDFFRRLEATIRREPRYYLWSHRRWKHTREEFERLFHEENGRVLRN